MTVPDTITVEAQNASGTQVTYTVTGANPAGNPVPVACDYPAGSQASGQLTVTATFPIGQTTVTCGVLDDATGLLESSTPFLVIVRDTTAPAVVAPAAVSVGATGSGGVSVQYGPASATDTVDGSLPATCSPASGSLFSVGTTVVTCSATDSHGNTGTASSTVTVLDTTPPVVSVPASVSATASGAGGATVQYAPASASDAVDGSLPATCSPASGSLFSVGTTEVTCSATDSHGNTGTASFTVSVNDPTAPTVTVPAPITAEATGPNGSAVEYTGVSATDAVEGPVPTTCAPPSGSVFPLGTTQVVCSASDSHGNTASASFPVTVADRTPPVIKAPATISIYADSNGTAPAGRAAIAAFLAGASVTDTVDPFPVITIDAPSSFPIGTTTVVFTATDHSGNRSAAASSVTVTARPAGGSGTPPPAPPPPPPPPPQPAPKPTPTPKPTPAPAPKTPAATPPSKTTPPTSTKTQTPAGQDGTTGGSPPKTSSGSGSDPSSSSSSASDPPRTVDRTPPGNVSRLKARAGDHVVTLSWKKPSDGDLSRVEVQRFRAPATAGKVVYQGTATSYKDRRLANGVQYRYMIVSVDRAGNRSAGAAAVASPKAQLLARPLEGARVTSPPLLVWAPVSRAHYYNVQLFRNGTKILSFWPGQRRLQLSSTWTYRGHRYRLTPGLYRWYVWPGFGAHRSVQYGSMLGKSSFVVVAKKS